MNINKNTTGGEALIPRESDTQGVTQRGSDTQGEHTRQKPWNLRYQGDTGQEAKNEAKKKSWNQKMTREPDLYMGQCFSELTCVDPVVFTPVLCSISPVFTPVLCSSPPVSHSHWTPQFMELSISELTCCVDLVMFAPVVLTPIPPNVGSSISKTCTICHTPKHLSEFFFQSKKKNTHQSACKSCSKKARNNAQMYQKNKPKYKANSKNRNQRLQHENRIKLLEYFKSHPCKICGECNPRVLQFDHKIQSEKLYNVSEKMNKYNWTILSKEIEKCDVLCANHHAMRTSIQLDWWYEDKQYQSI